jgi:hypothetical protein
MLWGTNTVTAAEAQSGARSGKSGGTLYIPPEDLKDVDAVLDEMDMDKTPENRSQIWLRIRSRAMSPR